MDFNTLDDYNYIIRCVKVNNPIAITIFICGWYTLFNVIKKLNPSQSIAWNSNVINFIHASIVTTISGYEWYSNYETKSGDLNYDITIAFFLYDLVRKPVGSVFFYHHIISIIGVSMIRESRLIVIGSKILLTMEMGNLPLYIVSGLMLSKFKYYWKNHKYFKTLLVFEFVWYVVCRCIYPILLFNKVKYPLYKLVVSGFIIGSTLWTKNMFRQLKKY